ncbi:MAG: TrkH family potassium uptake protein [Phycisphaerae bacterium]|nr:TrkH family potassium uptake protein [Phycisphaerae bacterium]
MNYRFVVSQLGLLLIVLSAVLVGIAGWEVVDVWIGAGTSLVATEALLSSVGLGLVIGGVMWWSGRGGRVDRYQFGRREALLLVSLSWIAGAALAAMPFWLWALLERGVPASHPFKNYVDCYFEAMSGLTTTGATVLGDIESLPRGLLLWRSLTQWLGGLGIVVLFVAVLPMVGVGGKKLFHTEAPGPTPSGMRPRIAETARLLWIMYLGLTGAAILGLWFTGMSWFDSICHTFSCVSSGGFSTRDASVGAFSTASTVVIIIFMVLSGVNFGLYFRLLRGSVKSIWADTELRFYIGMIVFGAAIIIFSLMFIGDPMASTKLVLDEQGNPVMTKRIESVTDEFGHTVVFENEVPKRIAIPVDLGHAVEYGVFNSVSIHTGTGFCTIDYNRWPFAAKATLVLLMIFGGCAGSTTGGLKVVRVWLSLKIVLAEVERVFRPNVVRPLRFGSTAVDTDLKLQVLAYVLAYFLVWVIGSYLVMLFEAGHPRCDYMTAASASMATLGNIGPGFGAVGAVENYGWMTSSSKGVLSVLMLLGRLEVVTVFVLFVPRFWSNP